MYKLGIRNTAMKNPVLRGHCQPYRYLILISLSFVPAPQHVSQAWGWTEFYTC